MTRPPPPRKATHYWGFMILVLLLAACLRIYRIDVMPLRGDEAFAILHWTQSLAQTLGPMAPIEPQPPLTFILFAEWARLAGNSELAARLLPTLFSLLAIPSIYRIGQRLSSDHVGQAAALLCALNPFQIWHAQDARSYAIWVGLSTLATWLMLQALHKNKLTAWLAYILTAAASAYTFYLEGLIILFQNTYTFTIHLRDRPLLRRWIGSQIGLAALLAPWYLQRRLYTGEYTPTGDYFAGLASIGWTIRSLSLGETLPDTAYQWVTLLIAALLISGLAIAFSYSRRWGWFLLFYAACPLVSLSAMATWRPYFRPRYLIASAPAYILTLATLLTWPTRPGKVTARLARLIPTILLIPITLYTLFNYYFDERFAKSLDWPALMAVIEQRVDSQDMIIRNYPDPAFDYYYHGNADHITLPSKFGTPLTVTQAKLAEIAATHRRLWFIPTESPYWDPSRSVQNWLTSNMQLVSQQWIGPFHLQEYASWQVSDGEIEHTTAYRLGEIAGLAGFSTYPDLDNGTTLHPGDQLIVILYWLPTAHSDVPLTVFVHLTGPSRSNGNSLWAQQDHPPQEGRVNTTAWPLGTYLRDVFTLTIPADAPPDKYSIEVGLYDPTTGQRLQAYDKTGQPLGDSIHLITLEVARR
jgi:hypothetical protein